MKKKVYLKSTFRQFVFALFLLLLLGFVSFAFISNAAQYIIVRQETERLGGYYRAIGSLYFASELFMETEPDDLDASEASDTDPIANAYELIENSDYFGFADARRNTTAVLDGIYNADIDGRMSDTQWSMYPEEQVQPLGLHLSDIYFYGTLNNIWQYQGDSEDYCMYFTVDYVEEGYPEYLEAGNIVWLYFPSMLQEFAEAELAGMEPGLRYFVKGQIDTDRLGRLGAAILTMRPLMDDDERLWFLPVAEGEYVDLAAPALTEIRGDLEVARENMRTMQVVATKDMSAIPAFQEVVQEFYVREGRLLTREDDLNANRVCVVHNRFLTMRGLSVGDTITLKFRDLYSHWGFGYIVEGHAWKEEYMDDPAADWNGWREYPSYEEEFTIIGTYSARDSTLSFYYNYVYIPDACLQADFGETSFANYSFVLDSARNQDAFLAETEEALAELGLKLTFTENDSANFWFSADPILQSAAANALMFAAVLLLALICVAFLYLRQRRREFAILRALGEPKKRAAGQLFAPIAIIGCIGIAAGGIPSWDYALAKAAETLSSLEAAQAVENSATLSVRWLILFCVAVFLLLLLFIWVGTQIVTHKPVLALLQGIGSKKDKRKDRKKHGKKQAAVAAENLPLAEAVLPSIPPPIAAKKAGLAVSARYVSRQIRRSAFKSILVAVVALGFVFALVWMHETIEYSNAEIDRLYDTTVVKAEILKRNPGETAYVYSPDGGSGIEISDAVINKDTVSTILKSDFVQSYYLVASNTWFSPYSVRAFDQVDRFLADMAEPIQIEYAEGWDSDLFTESYTKEFLAENTVPALLPASVMEADGLAYGDQITLMYTNYYSYRQSKTMQVVIVGKYEGYLLHMPVLVPLSALEACLGISLQYEVAEFYIDPAKNRELPALVEQAQAVVGKGNAGSLKLQIKFWDEALREAIAPMERNVALLSVLYPVTMAVTALIAIGLAVLLMLQSAKEAALMRVLGTTKRRTRATLCIRHLAVCLIGVFMGLLLPAILWGDISVVIAPASLLCAGIYLIGALLGASVASVSITKRMPLELLQVKE